MIAKYFIALIVIVVIPAIGLADEHTSNRIAIVVNKYLSEKIKDSLNTYMQDLVNEGYKPVLKPWSLEEQPNPHELKEYLKELYHESEGLQGAVLIGDLPIVILASGDFSIGSYPSDHYFMDVDGGDWDKGSNGYRHWHFWKEAHEVLKIWISRILVPESWGRQSDKANLIREYFRKNHEFRTGKRLYNERNWVYINTEWINYLKKHELDNDAFISWNEKTNFFIYDLPRAVFLQLVTENVHELGSWDIHGETSKIWVSPNNVVTSKDLRPLGIRTPFLIPQSCWVGNYTADDYFAGALLFSDKSEVQAVIAATVPIVTWRMDLFSYAFANGNNFGESYLKYLSTNKHWSEQSLGDESSRVILGDGTLKRQRYILANEHLKTEKNSLKPEVLQHIMPTSVLPLINTLRFNFHKKEIYWDRPSLSQNISYRLTKKKWRGKQIFFQRGPELTKKEEGEGDEITVYEGTENKAFDKELKQGYVYGLEYVWKEPESWTSYIWGPPQITKSQKAEVITEFSDLAIDRAIMNGNENLIQHLLSVRDPEEAKTNATLMELKNITDIEKFRVWLNSVDVTNENRSGTPIVYYVMRNPEMLRLALEAGADPNIKPTNRNEWFPSKLPIIYASESGNTETLRILLEHGANPHVVDDSGNTPFQALVSGYVIRDIPVIKEKMDILLSAGADINKQNKEGYTPLMKVIKDCRDEACSSLVVYLLDHGAKVGIKDNSGKSVVDYITGGKRIDDYIASEKGPQDYMFRITRFEDIEPLIFEHANKESAEAKPPASDSELK